MFALRLSKAAKPRVMHGATIRLMATAPNEKRRPIRTAAFVFADGRPAYCQPAISFSRFSTMVSKNFSVVIHA